MENRKISQSLLKAYNDYKGKQLCGLKLKAQYFDNLDFGGSEAMDLGNYFEYKATGSLPRNGKIPYPKLTYKGTKREQIATPYVRAIESAELFKKIKEHYKIEIKEVGLNLETQFMKGELDIWGTMKGIPCIIDLKYSGLIDNKWDERGWETESLPFKEKLMVQAVQYKMLVKENYGLNYEDFDFYFMVFSQSEVNNVKFIRVNIDEDAFEIHHKHIKSVYYQINKMDIEKDFIAYPSMKACGNCPLYDTCLFKTNVPIIEDIYYG